MVDRREFLRAGAGLALAGGALPLLGETPHVRRYVPLGRTGLKVSDISFGSAGAVDATLVHHALERGINYFDTAESYDWGIAERAIGGAIRGRRDQVVLSSKTKAAADHTRHDMMKALEGSLARLGTDYLDIYFNHAVDDVARMQNTEWWEFTELAKRQGKIRFRGMSGHGSALVACLDYALAHDLVDVILVAYSFAQDPGFADRLRHSFHWAAIQPELPRVLAEAARREVGVIAMKTLMGARLNDMRPFETDGATFAQAAFRWVLSNAAVDALIVSMSSIPLIDEYVAASGTGAPGSADLALLERYAALRVGNYCVPGCNACRESCPENVPIAEVLRTRMYDVDYAAPVLARDEYRALGGPAAQCLSCVHQACLGACTARIPIAEFTRDAARRLA